MHDFKDITEYRLNIPSCLIDIICLYICYPNFDNSKWKINPDYIDFIIAGFTDIGLRKSDFFEFYSNKEFRFWKYGVCGY